MSNLLEHRKRRKHAFMFGFCMLAEEGTYETMPSGPYVAPDTAPKS